MDQSSDVVQKMDHKIDCKQGAVRAVRFNVDGKYCLTCGSDKSVKLWNPHSSTHLKTYSGHGQDVLDADSSCDNSQLCSCGLDKTVVLWDVASGKVIRKYRGHAGTVNCVQFNEESSVIFSGSIDGSVRVWDCRTRKMEPMQILDDATDSVTSVQLSDHEVLVGCVDGRLRRYDIRQGQMHSDFIGKAVTCARFTRDGQCTLVSSLDNTIRLLDKDSGELLNEYKGHKNSEYKIDSCLNHKDTHIFSGSQDGHIFIWDLLEAKVRGKLAHPGGRAVHSLDHHPQEACLISASGREMYLWRPAVGGPS